MEDCTTGHVAKTICAQLITMACGIQNVIHVHVCLTVFALVPPHSKMIYTCMWRLYARVQILTSFIGCLTENIAHDSPKQMFCLLMFFFVWALPATNSCFFLDYRIHTLSLPRDKNHPASRAILYNEDTYRCS